MEKKPALLVYLRLTKRALLDIIVVFRFHDVIECFGDVLQYAVNSLLDDGRSAENDGRQSHGQQLAAVGLSHEKHLFQPNVEEPT